MAAGVRGAEDQRDRAYAGGGGGVYPSAVRGGEARTLTARVDRDDALIDAAGSGEPDVAGPADLPVHDAAQPAACRGRNGEGAVYGACLGDGVKRGRVMGAAGLGQGSGGLQLKREACGAVCVEYEGVDRNREVDVRGTGFHVEGAGDRPVRGDRDHDILAGDLGRFLGKDEIRRACGEGVSRGVDFAPQGGRGVSRVGVRVDQFQALGAGTPAEIDDRAVEVESDRLSRGDRTRPEECDREGNEPDQFQKQPVH